jgi:hypothetical protein
MEEGRASREQRDQNQCVIPLFILSVLVKRVLKLACVFAVDREAVVGDNLVPNTADKA